MKRDLLLRVLREGVCYLELISFRKKSDPIRTERQLKTSLLHRIAFAAAQPAWECDFPRIARRTGRM